MDLKNESSSNTNFLPTEEATIGPGEVIIGDLLSFDEQGRPQVNFKTNGIEPISALSTIALNHEHRGRQVALLFADGDLTKPVIMGVIHSPLLDILDRIQIDESKGRVDSQSDTGSSMKDEDPFKSDSSHLSTEVVNQVESHQEPTGENVAYIDGQKVILEGHDEIELRCGEASIRLTKAGKILIRGKYLLNRSSGVNRILGGSVQVN